MGAFNFSAKKHADGVLIVKLEGMLDIFAFSDFKKYFKNLSENSKGARVVVDLEAVDYIASSGWSVLIGGRRILQLHGGDLSIFGLHENLRRVYETMRIAPMLPMAANLDEADKLLHDHAVNWLPPGESLAFSREVVHSQNRRRGDGEDGQVQHVL